MRQSAFTVVCAVSVLAALAPPAAHADSTDFSGQIHAYHTMQPSSNTLQAELLGNTTLGTVTLHAGATMQAQQGDEAPGITPSRFNEAYAQGSAVGWLWSAGKRVVAWDVGYGFRPNDMVQQEVRRTLVPEPLEGRPLLMAERFDADTAWSVVWVNPTQEAFATGAQEAALAARAYWHSGAVDWHVFARQGQQSGASLGIAASWVASDALELHASVRGDQQLIGGTWTNTQQISLLVEAWPKNMYARVSWQHERWQPALDVLYMPADQGVLATASVVWTGERINIAMGLRTTAGPDSAMVRHMPYQRQGYVVASWPF